MDYYVGGIMSRLTFFLCLGAACVLAMVLLASPAEAG
jgi:hypothetical protein